MSLVSRSKTNLHLGNDLYSALDSFLGGNTEQNHIVKGALVGAVVEQCEYIIQTDNHL